MPKLLESSTALTVIEFDPAEAGADYRAEAAQPLSAVEAKLAYEGLLHSALARQILSTQEALPELTDDPSVMILVGYMSYGAMGSGAANFVRAAVGTPDASLHEGVNYSGTFARFGENGDILFDGGQDLSKPSFPATGCLQYIQRAATLGVVRAPSNATSEPLERML